MISAAQIVSAAGATAILAHLWVNPNAAPAAPLEAFEAMSAWANDLNAPSSGSSGSNLLGRGINVQTAILSSSDEVWNWSYLTDSLGGLVETGWYHPQSEIRLIKDTDLPQVKVEVGPGWAGLADKVQSWIDLPTDWDGDDGVAPSSAVIDAAVAFAHYASYGGAPKPELYIAGDGEVGFRWTTGEDFASVAFLNDGHVVVYCSMGAEEKPLKIDIAVEEAPDFSLLFKGLTRFAAA